VACVAAVAARRRRAVIVLSMRMVLAMDFISNCWKNIGILTV
jgi:hypothetical protein